MYVGSRGRGRGRDNSRSEGRDRVETYDWSSWWGQVGESQYLMPGRSCHQHSNADLPVGAGAGTGVEAEAGTKTGTERDVWQPTQQWKATKCDKTAPCL